MASRKQTLAKKARGLQNAVEHSDATCAYEPRLSRGVVAWYQTNRASRPVKSMRFTDRPDFRHWADQIKCKGGRLVRVERYWQVRWVSVGGGHYGGPFDNLAMALAMREGLRFHHARYIMAQGTDAMKRL